MRVFAAEDGSAADVAATLRGETDPRPINMRIKGATHRSFARCAAADEWNEDLKMAQFPSCDAAAAWLEDKLLASTHIICLDRNTDENVAINLETANWTVKAADFDEMHAALVVQWMWAGAALVNIGLARAAARWDPTGTRWKSGSPDEVAATLRGMSQERAAKAVNVRIEGRSHLVFQNCAEAAAWVAAQR